jgi:hypothetical protein
MIDHRAILQFCVAGAIVIAAGSAPATPGLSLSSPADLAHLHVGDTVAFQVSLTSLGAGQELDSLSATVIFGGGILGTPTVSAGTIIPSPLADPYDLLMGASGGQVDVSFMTYSAAAAGHIRSDGPFCTYYSQVLAPGTGSVSFDFVDATQYNTADPSNPIGLTVGQGDPLSLTALSVSEPSALALLAACGAVIVAFRSAKVASGLPIAAPARFRRPRAGRAMTPAPTRPRAGGVGYSARRRGRLEMA